MRIGGRPYLFLAVMASVVMAKIGFEKDLGMDVVFPGPVYRPDPNIPEGHMRPLGWQRKTDGPIEEVSGSVSPIEFYHEYVSRDLPIVMRDALPESAPIFDNWKEDSYILNQYSQVNVSVRVKMGRYRGKVQTASEVMTVKKFLSEYKYEEWYLSSVLPVEMMEEIPLPACVRCGTVSERLWSSQLWMSSGGTSSRVHSHDDHLLHCVLFGRRDFILIESYHKKNFDFVPEYSGAIGGHSDINTDKVDMFKYGQIARVPWTWSTIKPGDCLFVPAGYVHQVRSYGRSISVTIEFSPLKIFDDSGCTLEDEEFTPLSTANFQWAFDGGQLRLTNRNLIADHILNIFLCLIGKNEKLTFHKFNHFYSTLSANATASRVPSSRQVFDMVTSNKNQMYLNLSDLLNASPKDLTKVAEAFNSLHGDSKRNKADTMTKQRQDRRKQHEEF